MAFEWRTNLLIQYYNRAGMQCRESSRSDDENVAKKLLRKRLGEVAAGIEKDPRGLRYEELRDAHLDACITEEKKSLRRDKNGKVYLEPIRRLDSFFKGYRVIDIDVDSIRKFQTNQKSQGLSNGSINRSVAALRRMFTRALQDERLRNIPHFPMMPEAQPRKGTLPQDKYTALLAALPAYLRPVVAIGHKTGMRLGEIQNLRWSNIIWLDRIIRLDAGTTKNGEAREIPFGDELESVLREQYASRKKGCDCVCYRLDRQGHPRPIGNFRKPWARACVKIGVGEWLPVVDPLTKKPVFEPKRYERSKPKQKREYVGLIFHDLRRTFVTDAEHSGAPRHEVMAMSGHQTESIYKRYAINNRERRRVALDQIEAYRASKVGAFSGQNEAEAINADSQQRSLPN